MLAILKANFEKVVIYQMLCRYFLGSDVKRSGSFGWGTPQKSTPPLHPRKTVVVKLPLVFA